jgi:hypothetical protein
LGASKLCFGALFGVEAGGGDPRSRWSARSAERTNDLDLGVAAATRSPLVVVVIVASGDDAPGRRGSGNRHNGVRELGSQCIVSQMGAPESVRPCH